MGNFISNGTVTNPETVYGLLHFPDPKMMLHAAMTTSVKLVLASWSKLIDISRLLLISVVISRPRSCDSSALEFILRRS